MQIIGSNNDVTLVWVTGHRGIEGNEIVDMLAKSAAKNKTCGAEPFCGISNRAIKAEKTKWLRDKFVNYWARALKMNHFKRMVDFHNPKISKNLLSTSKKMV